MARPTANPLVKALATGEPGGYAALYDRLGRSMLRVARTMLRSSAEAEDVVQDVFVELVRHRDRIGQVQDLHSYIFAMLRNQVLRRLKRQETERLHLQQFTPASVNEPQDVLPDEFENAMKTLPPEQREVIALKIDGELTFAQIGEILNVSPNTAASRYRYALEKLRRILE